MTPLKGSLFVAAAASMWAMIGVIGKSLHAGGVDPLVTATWRASIAAFLYVLISLCARQSVVPMRAKDIPFFAAYGLFCVVGMYCFFMLAVTSIPVAVATVLLYTAPLWVMLFSRLFLAEPFTRLKTIALFIAFLGCFLVVRGYDLHSLHLNLRGVLYGLAAGVSYAMLSILGKVGLKRYTALSSMTYALCFGALFMWFIRPPWVLLSRSYSLSQWTALWSLAVLCTVVPNVLYVLGLSAVEAGKASIIATLEPPVAALLALLVFGETLELWQVLGMLLVLTGVSLPFARQLHSSEYGNRQYMS